MRFKKGWKQEERMGQVEKVMFPTALNVKVTERSFGFFLFFCPAEGRVRQSNPWFNWPACGVESC